MKAGEDSGMGNSGVLVDRPPDVLAASLDSESFGGVTGNTTITTDDTPKRRIVKATPPTTTSTPDTTASSSSPSNENGHTNDDDEDDNEDEKGDNSKKRVHTNGGIGVSSPSYVAREEQQESLEEHHKERMELRHKQQKGKREKAIQERRKNPRSDVTTPQANPFSRFFSAFSVESKYPEHKRSYARAAGGDVTDLHDDDHMVKKFKQQDDTGIDVNTADAVPADTTDDDDDNNTNNSWNLKNGIPIAAVAATAVAVLAVVIALRPKK